MQYEFTYSGETIPYQVIVKNVKNINIRVKTSGEVIISCAKEVDNKTIELQMLKHIKWLSATIKRYKENKIEFTATNLKFVDGEAFLLLGKVLRIKNYYGHEFKVTSDNNYLYIYRENKVGIKSKFTKWYNQFILQEFDKQVEKAYQRYQKYGISKPKVIYKNMKTQWGSCHINKGIITLNTQLIKVDPFLTEYVICHELTHLIYKNHTSDFYAFLTSMVPDWKQREQILNKIFINNIGGLKNDN